MNTDKALPIDKEVLSKVFYYDPTSTTGLRWKVWNKARGPVRRNAGDVAGKLYYCSGEKRKHEKHMGRVNYNSKTYPIHRVIWTLEVGEIPDEFIIDNPNYQLQGAIKLEQPPVIKDGYTMVPVRFIAEEMGYDVKWNGKNKTITISK